MEIVLLILKFVGVISFIVAAVVILAITARIHALRRDAREAHLRRRPRRHPPPPRPRLADIVGQNHRVPG